MLLPRRVKAILRVKITLFPLIVKQEADDLFTKLFPENQLFKTLISSFTVIFQVKE